MNQPCPQFPHDSRIKHEQFLFLEVTAEKQELIPIPRVSSNMVTKKLECGPQEIETPPPHCQSPFLWSNSHWIDLLLESLFIRKALCCYKRKQCNRTSTSLDKTSRAKACWSINHVPTPNMILFKQKRTPPSGCEIGKSKNNMYSVCHQRYLCIYVKHVHSSI